MRAESLKRWVACLAGGMSMTWILRVLWVQYGQHSKAIRLFNRVVLNPIVLAFAGRAGMPYAQFPGRQLHIGRRLPEIEAIGHRRNQGDGKGSSCQVSSISSTLGKLLECCPVTNGDEMSGLRILRALRPPTCIQDRANRFFRQGFISELANSTLGADEFGDRHARVPPCWLQPTIKAEAYSAISNRPSHCITMQLHVMNAPVLPKNVHLKIS